MQRRHHYERAFEEYLRARRIPYVAVDEARKALLPAGACVSQQPGGDALKSFDFVVYGQNTNLLIDIKGRKIAARRAAGELSIGRLDSWVTEDDVECLTEWAKIFGSGFEPAFVFMFWCEAEPPDALFQEMFEFGERWYAVLAMRLSDYKVHQKPRSAKWGTVSIPAKAFNAAARPLKEML